MRSSVLSGVSWDDMGRETYIENRVSCYAQGMTRARKLLVLATVAGLATGCNRSSEGKGEAAAENSAGAATAVKPDPCVGAEAHGPLAWFEDDYAAARACAEATDRPLVIDMWAPWCHTCLSMKHTVLVDRGLEPLADRFVWLAIDTDREGNAPVVDTFPPVAWPTFFIVSPKDEAVQARHVGSASVDQFRELLTQGEKGHLDSRAGEGGLPEGSPLLAVRDGDRAANAGDLEAAEAAYRAALDKAPSDWTRRPGLLVSLIGVLAKRQDWAGCAELASGNMDKTGRSASAADFAYYATVCANELEDGAAKKALLSRARARLAGLIEDRDAPLSVDDRSDAMRILREVHLALGEKEAADALARRQRAVLDAAATNASTPFEAMTYNWPRAEVYSYLGVPGELIADLKKSVADLPNEYDPPYRLAWIYAQTGELALALDLARRALGLAYGPRKTRVASLIVDLHEARGDLEAQVEAQAELVKVYEALPEGQARPDALEAARDRLTELRAELAGK
jgi:thiol-disulfide isomerase/thioredoxin